jgi:tetratricopeptide (TPR) repeat protein
LDSVLAYLENERQTSRLAPGDFQELHYFLSKRANAHFDRGEFDLAVERYQTALALAPSFERTVKLTSLVGKAFDFVGDESAARRYFLEAHQLAGDDDALRSFVLEQEAHCAGHRGDYETARRVAAEQVAINRRLVQVEPTNELSRALLYSLINLGTAELRLARLPSREVLNMLEEALEIARRLNHQELKADALWSLGESYHVLGVRDRAWQYLHEAHGLYQEQGKTRDQAEIADFMRKHHYEGLFRAPQADVTDYVADFVN